MASREILTKALEASGISDVLDPAVPRWLDEHDDLHDFRSEFNIPPRHTMGADAFLSKGQSLDDPSVYLCGNSLGLMPKRTGDLIQEELKIWSERAVDGHFDHPLDRPWKTADELVKESLANIVGADVSEVVAMGALTSNLHHMMISFYRPTPSRFKILYEAKAFPSDQYAFESQVLLHKLDPSTALLPLSPRPGEHTLRTEDILSAIEREGNSIALVLFSGVQFYTGQWFEMEKITKAAQERGCTVGWDLAHAVGNVPLRLHDWGVDFAVWCSYKYLNASPGGLAGIFVHSKYTCPASSSSTARLPRLVGWWGHDPETRFEMNPTFVPSQGASAWMLSNTPVLPLVALLGSTQLFDRAGGVGTLRKKSLLLTAYLDTLLRASPFFLSSSSTADAADRPGFTILTSEEPEQRGAQLSLLFLPARRNVMQQVFDGLKKRGVTGDERKPDVIRLAPVPLYNTFADVRAAWEALEDVLREVQL